MELEGKELFQFLNALRLQEILGINRMYRPMINMRP